MSSTGRIALFDAANRRYFFEEFPVPDPEPGAVLLRISMASICGSDIHGYRLDQRTATGAVRDNSRIARGHEGIGTVYKLGEGVTTDSAGKPLQVGDRVVYSLFYPCNHCRACLAGKDWCCPDRRKTYDGVKVDVWPHFRASFEDYHYLFPGHTLFKISDALSDHMACTINCALGQVTCGLDVANLRLGENVVIQGAGGLGISAVAVARENGAGKVVVIDGVPERLEMASAFGADEIIDLRELPTPEQRVARVKELTGGWGADLVVGLVGYPQAVDEGIKMVGQGGRHLEIGSIAAGHTYAADPEKWVHGNVTIHGNNNYGRRHLRDAFELMQRTSTKYPWERIISHVFPLSDINEAMAAQDKGHVERAGLIP